MTPEERFERIEESLATVATSLAQVSVNVDSVSERLRQAVRLSVQEARAERRRRKQAIAEIDEKITQLACAQLLTEQTLKAFIDSLRRGGNGHT